MQHELKDIEITIYRATSVPEGLTLGQAEEYIVENGAISFTALGIDEAVRELTASGVRNTMVRFYTANSGRMTMQGRIFVPWAQRMSRLVNA